MLSGCEGTKSAFQSIPHLARFLCELTGFMVREEYMCPFFSCTRVMKKEKKKRVVLIHMNEAGRGYLKSLGIATIYITVPVSHNEAKF